MRVRSEMICRRVIDSTETTRRLRSRSSRLGFDRLERRVVLSTITWNSVASPAGGNWDTPGNWVGGAVPGAADNAVIALASGSVTFNEVGGESVKSITSSATTGFEIAGGTLSVAALSTFNGPLTIDGGTLSGSGDVTTNALLSWTAGGMSGFGATNAHGGLSIGKPDSSYYGITLTTTRTLNNFGAASVSSGLGPQGQGLDVHVQYSFMTNGPNANLTLNGNVNFTSDGSDGGTLINQGTLNALGDAGPNTLDTNLVNSGLLNVLSGTLTLGGNLEGGSTFLNGTTIHVAADSILRFGEDLPNQNNVPVGVIVPIGVSVTAKGAGTILVASNQGDSLFYPHVDTFGVEGSFTSEIPLVFQAGSLGGSGTLATKAPFTWSGGVMQGTGTTEVLGGLALTGLSTALGISRPVLAGSRALNNHAAATVSNTWVSVADSAVFTNVAGASLTFSVADTTPVGGVTANTGRLLNEGTIVVATPSGSHASFIESLLTNAGTLTVQSGSLVLGGKFTNTGSVNVEGGTLSVSGGFKNLDTTTSTLNGGSYFVSGMLFIPSPIVNNHAAITLGAMGTVDALSALTNNAAGGSLTLQVGASLTTSSAFNNAGMLSIGTACHFTTTGTFTQSSGTTTLGGGTLFSTNATLAINGGVVTGFGTVVGNLTSSGTIQPTPTGPLTIQGNYTQSPGGTLKIVIAGPGIGDSTQPLTVTATAHLAGTLAVELSGGYVPPLGATFQALSYSSLAGTFPIVSGAVVGDRQLDPSYGSTATTLVTDPVAPGIAPSAESSAVTMSDPGVASVTLSGSDTEDDPSTLVFTISSLPAGRLLQADGSAVYFGETFTGSPVGLTYQIPLLAFGNFSVSFTYTVTANRAATGTTSTSDPATVTINAPTGSDGIARIGGTTGDDAIMIGTNGTNLIVSLNGVSSTVSVPVTSVGSIEVFGRDGNDTLTVSRVNINTGIDQGAGSTRLILNGMAQSQVYDIQTATVGFGGALYTGYSALTVNGSTSSTFNISGIEVNADLNGGPSFDRFNFIGDGSILGSIDGGGGAINTLSYAAYNTGVMVNLGTSTATGLSSFQNIGSFLGSLVGGNVLIGPNASNFFELMSTGRGTLNGPSGPSFSNFGNLVGGNLDDTFQFDSGGSVSGIIDGGAGSNTISYTHCGGATVNLQSMRSDRINGGFVNIQSFLGDNQLQSRLVGPDLGSTYTLTGNNTVAINGSTFHDFAGIRAGLGDDVFKVVGIAQLSRLVDGGPGVNTIDYSAYPAYALVAVSLASSTASVFPHGFANFEIFVGNVNPGDRIIAPDTDSIFRVNGVNSGMVNDVSFSRFGTLFGGAGKDTFAFSDGGSVSNTVDGFAGTNTLDDSSSAAPVTVNIANSSASNIGNRVVNIRSFVGASTSGNQLIGPDSGVTFNINGGDSGNVAGMTFSRFDTLIGGKGNDTFKLAGSALVSGSIDGGLGTNTLDDTAIGSMVRINLATSQASRILGNFANIETFLGGNNPANQLIGPDAGATFNITSPNAVNLGGMIFASFGTLFGGNGKDNFKFSPGATISNAIDGGGGTNAIDYSLFTTSVNVNLATGVSTAVAVGISNIRYAWGGSGADTLTAGSLGGVLVGNAGDDTLIGGSDRNLLIGGLGSDTVLGGPGDDILIGGGTAFDNSFAVLDAILTQWKSTYYDEAARVRFLRNGGGLNGNNKLVWQDTVIDDASADVLEGRAGFDWFFKAAGDSADDTVGEPVN